ncbi:MAG: hypothetical protein HYZ25_20000 [Chloroflexi bacterium]|nr:hypothetical protein [Chloroflexota bacterium]
MKVRVFALTWLLLLVSACAPTASEAPVIAPSPTVTAIPIPLTEIPAEQIFCAPPYAQDSIWNTPIDWQVARIHPQSNQMMAAFFKRDDWIGSDVTQYAPNIYYADANTPLVPVTMWPSRSFRDALSDAEILYGQPGDVVFVPLPSEAQPAPGTDGELVIVNRDTGEEWGLAKASREIDGSWSAGSVYRYHLNNSGVPPKGFAQRGAGIGSLAGIVRPCEVKQGEVRHAVTIAYDYPCAPDVCATNGWPAVIPPFTKTDGEGISQYDIPEGARLVIRPEISASEIEQVCKGMRGCVVWVKAMQVYGGFIVDNSGHPKTYGEGNLTARWDSSLWSDDMLRNIPPDWYAVLDWNFPAN